MLNSIVALLESGAGGGGGAYESIATATGTGSSGTITFSSIPSTYASLQIRLIGRASIASAAENIRVTANNDSASNYAYHRLTGDGSAAACSGFATTANMALPRISSGSAAAGNMGVAIIDVADYASTSKYKTFRSITGYDQNGTGQLILASGLWQSTSAINRIDLVVTGANFTTDTVFSLYGIKGA